MAQWRVRRGWTQQILADRLGKSKSWVDKVERGVRALDRFSVIQHIAEVLRVDASVLLGVDARTSVTTVATEGVDGLRAALARYDVLWKGHEDRAALPAGEEGRRVAHAWLAYEHADYPQLVRMLPDLLCEAQRAHVVVAGAATASRLVQAYRITTSVLVKLGEPELAWLSGDRAMAAAGADPLLAAAAAISLGQALRASGRGRLALAAMTTAAARIAPPAHEGRQQELALCGTLLVEASLAAAASEDARRAAQLIDQAAEFAARVSGGHDHHRTAFGPITVEMARVLAAIDLDDGGEAITWHEKVIARSAWGRLSAEQRAAHLVNVARAYLQVGDLLRAGRALVDADRTAPAEVRSLPVARTLIKAVMSRAPAPAGVARLAILVGLTR
ncbi:helix-turn-helix domain-containing protein [Micromonospora zamorensis]|uniref:helix-turn-helix domain-containing protein n=1 Tax=Micromonospora zamorensis TaxID=709883 RepID=UPI00339F6256